MSGIVIEKKIVTSRGEKIYRIKELEIGEIIDLLSLKELGPQSQEAMSFSFLKSVSDKFFRKSIEDFDKVKEEDFRSMAPSDVKTLWEAFQEANASFFDFARLTGVLPTLVETAVHIKRQILLNLQIRVQKNFSSNFAALLNRDTPEPTDTASPSSSEH